MIIFRRSESGEYQALCSLMDRYSYGGLPIFIADRGFASYNVFAHAMENNIDFIIRAKDVNTKRLLGTEKLADSMDEMTEVILTRTHSKKKHRHPEKEGLYRYVGKGISFDYLNPDDIYDEYPLKLRAVRFEVTDGIYENIMFYIKIPSENHMRSRLTK
jgi:hypothetical protein